MRLAFYIICLMLLLSLLVYADKVEISLIIINVEATTDWTTIYFYNMSKVLWLDYQVVEGENVPHLKLFITPNMISISKIQYDSSKISLKIYLLVSNPRGFLDVKITKGAIGYVKLEFYEFFNNKERLITIIEHYRNESDIATNPFSFRISLEDLRRYSIDVQINKMNERYVCAVYYPWYGTPIGLSKSWRHWENVQSFNIGSSTHYPLIGPYDSSEYAVINSHLEMLKRAGVNCLLISWWGINTYEDLVMNEIFTIAQKYDIKIGVIYESIRPWDKNIEYPEFIIKELKYILDNYGSKQNYLKIYNKSVIFIYGAYYNKDSIFWKKIKNLLSRESYDVFLVGDATDPAFEGYFVLDALTPDRMDSLFDVFKLYSTSINSSFTLTKIFEGDLRLYEKIISYTVLPGFNDTKIRKPGTVIDRGDGKFYSEFWDRALRKDPHMVIIFSFNEWHEGSEIEPSVEYGIKYLEITQHYSHKFLSDDSVNENRWHLFFADFEWSTGGFLHQVSTPNAEWSGPTITYDEKFSGRASLKYSVVSKDRKLATSALMSPVFVAIRDVPIYVMFCAKLEGLGYVDVALWVRPKSVATLGYPFHATPDLLPDLPYLYRIYPSNTWKCYTIDINSVFTYLNISEPIEFYFNWYVNTENKAELFIDDFIITTSTNQARYVDKDKVTYRLFISANATHEEAIYRIAFYLYNNSSGIVSGLKVIVNGASIIGKECKKCIVIPPFTYGKYVVYVKGNVTDLKVQYIINDTSYILDLGAINILSNSTKPLIIVNKTITKINEYEALVSVLVKNVGGTAYHVKIEDLLPRGIYIVKGTIKINLETLLPGEEYNMTYIIHAYYDGEFTLPKARVIYYDDALNEYYAWSNTASVYLKGSATSVSSVQGNIRIFPERPSPCKVLYVVHGYRDILVTSIQGVYNKYEPCIYIANSYEDYHWLRELVLQYGVQYKEVNLTELLQISKKYIKGYIVIDPKIPDTINIATFLASLYDAAIVEPQNEHILFSLGYQRIFDLRDRWSSREEMYEWAIRNLLPLANDEVLAILEPSVVELRDYLIATQTFTFRLSPRHDGTPYSPYDWVLLEEIYDRFYPPLTILGWWFDEGPNVDRLSERGFAITATDYVPNLSLLSAFRLLHPLVQYTGKESSYTYDNNGIYITIIRSDGDNTAVLYRLMFGKGGYAWLHPRRSSEPYGWTLQPLLVELAPVILQYYYQTRTMRDEFIAGPTGAGYYYPPYVKKIYRYTRYIYDNYYTKLADVKIINYLGGTPLVDYWSVYQWEHALFTGASYYIYGYAATGAEYRNSIFKIGNTLNVFVHFDYNGLNSEDIVNGIKELEKKYGKPLFILIYAINWNVSYEDFLKLVSILKSSGYYVIKPSEFFNLLERIYAHLGFTTISSTTYRAFENSQNLSDLQQIIMNISLKLNLYNTTRIYMEEANKQGNISMMYQILRTLLAIQSLRKIDGFTAAIASQLYSKGYIADALKLCEDSALKIAKMIYVKSNKPIWQRHNRYNKLYII